MHVMQINYCRRCLLPSYRTEEEKYNARALADELHVQLVREGSWIKRLEIVIYNTLWKATGEQQDVMEIWVNGKYGKVIQIREAEQLGTVEVARLLHQKLENH